MNGAKSELAAALMMCRLAALVTTSFSPVARYADWIFSGKNPSMGFFARCPEMQE